MKKPLIITITSFLLIIILFLVSILFLLKNYKIMPKNAVETNKTKPVFSEIDEKRQACLDTGEGMSYCTLAAIDELKMRLINFLKNLRKFFLNLNMMN